MMMKRTHLDVRAQAVARAPIAITHIPMAFSSTPPPLRGLARLIALARSPTLSTAIGARGSRFKPSADALARKCDAAEAEGRACVVEGAVEARGARIHRNAAALCCEPQEMELSDLSVLYG